jgi:hypothetical protein
MPCEGSFQEDYLGIAPELLQSTPIRQRRIKTEATKGCYLSTTESPNGKISCVFLIKAIAKLNN